MFPHIKEIMAVALCAEIQGKREARRDVREKPATSKNPVKLSGMLMIRILRRWARLDSNQRPEDYESPLTACNIGVYKNRVTKGLQYVSSVAIFLFLKRKTDERSDQMIKRTGHLYQKKKGGSWYVRIMVNGKLIVRSLSTPNKREAVKRRDEILRPFFLGDEAAVLKSTLTRLSDNAQEIQVIDARANPPPALSDVWDRYKASPSRPDSGSSTLAKYGSEWRRFAVWLEAEYPQIKFLHEVTSAIAAEYALDLNAAKLSASTFNQHVNFLCLLWRVMAKDAKLPENVWGLENIARRKLNALASRKRALTPAQFESLLATVEKDPDLHDLFILLAWTGQRLADIVLLKWGSIDFKAQVISLAPIKTARRQGKMIHIPIFDAAADVLNRRQSGKALNPAGYVFPDLADAYNRDTAQLSKRITAAFKKAGMETSEVRADRERRAVVYGAHSLRHLFTTAAASVGMPAAMIKSITGHATDEMMQHYQHLGVEHAAELALRIRSGNGRLIPAIASDPNRKAAISSQQQVLHQKLRSRIEAMTANTWQDDRVELLNLLSETAE